MHFGEGRSPSWWKPHWFILTLEQQSQKLSSTTHTNTRAHTVSLNHRYLCKNEWMISFLSHFSLSAVLYLISASLWFVRYVAAAMHFFPYLILLFYSRPRVCIFFSPQIVALRAFECGCLLPAHRLNYQQPDLLPLLFYELWNRTCVVESTAACWLELGLLQSCDDLFILILFLRFKCHRIWYTMWGVTVCSMPVYFEWQGILQCGYVGVNHQIKAECLNPQVQLPWTGTN